MQEGKNRYTFKAVFNFFLLLWYCGDIISKLRKEAMFRVANAFVKWFHGTSNDTLRLTVLGVTRNVEENEMRNALKFLGGASVFALAFYVSHKNAMRMMDANSTPAPTSRVPWMKENTISLDHPSSRRK